MPTAKKMQNELLALSKNIKTSIITLDRSYNESEEADKTMKLKIVWFIINYYVKKCNYSFNQYKCTKKKLKKVVHLKIKELKDRKCIGDLLTINSYYKI
ncbi:hypothetical protein QTP88_000694 [Uroleucon formosanum]